MLRGTISTVLACEDGEIRSIAERLGKKVEDYIYYKKIGEQIRSVLTPSPQKILDQAEALSVSSSFYLRISKFNSLEAELALMAEASGIQGIVLTDDIDTFNKYFGELSISRMAGEFRELDVEVPDKGYVYIDRAFNVRGVGVVVLGFTLTQVNVHDKLIALPMKKEVEVRSIQVLDEDQEGVLPGTRIGFALKNVKLEEIEGINALVKPGIRMINKIKFKKFKWALDSKTVHVVAGGFKLTGTVEGDEIILNGEIPETVKRGIVLNVNAKPKTPRVIGYSYID